MSNLPKTLDMLQDQTVQFCEKMRFIHDKYIQTEISEPNVNAIRGEFEYVFNEYAPTYIKTRMGISVTHSPGSYSINVNVYEK